MYAALKLRNPGWPPEGASGCPVSVLMPGHIAPEDDRRAMEAESERGSGAEWITEAVAEVKKPWWL